MRIGPLVALDKSREGCKKTLASSWCVHMPHLAAVETRSEPPILVFNKKTGSRGLKRAFGTG
ncbi:kelch domain-containing protein 9 [Roseibium sp. TrichSKD4]|nr:kelch domain-containing protein 9 [Roseibium sp. TrichSKD4]